MTQEEIDRLVREKVAAETKLTIAVDTLHLIPKQKWPKDKDMLAKGALVRIEEVSDEQARP